MARSVMKLKTLQSHLEDVSVFEKPNLNLEQYPTNPRVAAEMLHMIETSYKDIAGKSLADLGCGCGILSIGSAIMGADYILGIDIDDSALEVCQENLEAYDIDNVDLLQQDITTLYESVKDSKCPDEHSDSASDSKVRLTKMFDTVIMNPPFGTKENKGMDMVFVQTGLSLARRVVYSLHKASTRSHIQQKAKDWAVDIEILIPNLIFKLPNTLKMHKEKSVDVDVDFIRFSHKKKK